MTSPRATIFTDGYGGDLRARVPFNLKDLVKSFPGSRWNPGTKEWSVPGWALDDLVALLRHHGCPVDVISGGEPVARRESQLPASWAQAMFAEVPAPLHHRLFRACAGVLHPDVGGDASAMQALNIAFDRVRVSS